MPIPQFSFQMSVTIVLPCYNPPSGWAEHIIEVYKQLRDRIPEPIDLIIVRDGASTTVAPESVALLQEQLPAFQFITYETNRGKGYAVREGVQRAQGEIILYTDIDFPYDIPSILSIYEALAGGFADVAVGVKNEDYYKHVPPIRRAISKNLRFIIGVFFSMPITDTQCGLKGFTKTVKPLFLRTQINRYLFDLEFIRNCFKSKEPVRVKAIPIQLNEDVTFRRMNYKILASEVYSFLKLVIRG